MNDDRSSRPTPKTTGSPAIEFSLIIPAWNEAKRLPGFLASIREYLPTAFNTNYEVIVVDDGSRDGTGRLLDDAARDWPQLRGLAHATNRGKGAAVRTGMLAARGALWLFADADGATPIQEERRLREAIFQGAAVAVGSRALADPMVSRHRSRHRGVAGRLFARAVERLFQFGIQDTQCGFKMFPRDMGAMLFALAREDGYLFDVELLDLARRSGLRVAEVAVTWHEIAGSKVILWRDGPRLWFDLLRLKKQMRRALAKQLSGPVHSPPISRPVEHGAP